MSIATETSNVDLRLHKTNSTPHARSNCYISRSCAATVSLSNKVVNRVPPGSTHWKIFRRGVLITQQVNERQR